MVTEDQLRDRLRAVDDPELGVDVVSLGFVTDVHVEADVAVVSLAFNAPLSPSEWTMCDEIRALCQGVGLEPRIYADTDRDRGIFSGVKNTVAVGSSDPDAGAPLVTANLAMGLASFGARVGVFDVAGDDGGTWLDEVEPPDLSTDPIVPRTVRGISVVRLGPLVPSSDSTPDGELVLDLAVPTIVDALEWGAIDYLLVSLPYGTDRGPAAVVDRVPTDGTIAVSSVETDPARVRTTVQELTELGSTVIGVLETADVPGSNGIGVERDWHPTELGCPHLGTVPLDRCTVVSECDEPVTRRVYHERERMGPIEGERSPYRTLALSIMDRIGAVNRQSVTQRQLP